MSEDDNITKTPEYQEIAKLILPFFGGDHDKVDTWFLCENPMLGGITPIDMLFMGRFEKLLKIVKTALDENQTWQNRN